MGGLTLGYKDKHGSIMGGLRLGFKDKHGSINTGVMLFLLWHGVCDELQDGFCGWVFSWLGILIESELKVI